MKKGSYKHRRRFGLFGRIFCALPHNDHKPHILRGATLIGISVISVFLMGISFARYYFLHGTVLGQEIISSVLIDLTNETREKYGESPLLKNQKLENASLMKAEDMATYEYFSHNSPTGVTPWYWIKKAEYDFLYAGENLAIDFTESKDVEDAWMKSPTHKANILNNKFKEIGISTKEGMIDGHNTIYVVQMFGTPKSGLDLKDTPKEAIVDSTIQETNNSNVVASSVETSTTSSSTKINGEVAGTNIENNPIKQAETKEEYVTIASKDNMIVVADRQAVENGDGIEAAKNDFSGEVVVKYSNFWQKLLYNFWYDLNIIYKIFVGAIMFALFLLFFVEFRKHHWRHMIYGFITIILLLVLLYLNQNLW